MSARAGEFVEWFGRERASAILRTDIEEAAAPAMEAAIEGGFRVVEFTLTVPGALDRIEEFARRDGLWVGAGTVLSVEDARAAVDRGARFLVSPVVDPGVVEEAERLGVACMPGCHTPTEMWTAHRAGAALVKLFPAPGIGPAFVKAVLGPMPFLRIVPTAGVDESNCADYIASGSYAIGFVAPLFDPADLAAGRYDAIRDRAHRILSRVRAAGAAAR